MAGFWHAASSGSDCSGLLFSFAGKHNVRHRSNRPHPPENVPHAGRLPLANTMVSETPQWSSHDSRRAAHRCRTCTGGGSGGRVHWWQRGPGSTHHCRPRLDGHGSDVRRPDPHYGHVAFALPVCAPPSQVVAAPLSLHGNWKSTMIMHTRRRLLGLAAGASLAWPGVTAWARSAAPEPFTLAGWSKPITEIVNLLAAPDKAFFKEEAIEFRYLPGAGGGDALRNLLSGQADIAFTDPGSFFAALDKGAALRAVYDIYPQNVFNVVTLKNSGITRPSELKGKRIGVYSLSSGTLQNLQILLQQVGLTRDDVKIIVTGLLNFAPLMQGQVDATAATDTGLALARRRGLGDATVFQVADYLNYSSDLLVVREDFYQEHTARLRRFLRAF